MSEISVKGLVKQPLTHFVLAGFVLFIFVSLVKPEASKLSTIINVDKAQIAKLKNLYESQMGIPPEQAELDSLIEKYIEDEIFYREALREGLEEDDDIIRRRLIQKMSYLSSISSNATKVSEQELLSFFTKNPSLFKQPAKVSFQHLYFNPELDSHFHAKKRAESMLSQASFDSSIDSPIRSDHFPLQNTYSDLSQRSALQLFGKFPLVDALYSLKAGEWHGPYQSGYGWHLIYIDQINISSIPAFDDVKDQVIAEYQEHQQGLISDANLNKMRQRYQVNFN